MKTKWILAVILTAVHASLAVAASPSASASPAVPRMAPTWKSAADRPATGRGLRVGDRAPEFALRGASGRRVRLSELRQRGPVVLVFFRGHW